MSSELLKHIKSSLIVALVVMIVVIIALVISNENQIDKFDFWYSNKYMIGGAGALGFLSSMYSSHRFKSLSSKVTQSQPNVTSIPAVSTIREIDSAVDEEI